jgi:riboflavin kinase/FMN adenylyltransferase
MQVFRNLEEIPQNVGATIVSVGNFDGVHRAHQLVLQRIVARARELEAKSVAVTFDPHPVAVLRPESAPKLLTPTERKLELLAQSGIEAALVVPFTQDFSRMAAPEFAAHVLRDRLRAREVHEGANFRFGNRAQGNVQQLQQLGRDLGFEVQIYQELRLRGELVSSSRIRELIAAGSVSKARALLGRVFSIRAHPSRGRGYGTRYTVPTINLSDYAGLVPANGVYVTRTRIGDEVFDSVTNVGVRPTFENASFAIESHLFEFHAMDVPENADVEICFLRRLRDERKFPSADALRRQITHDVARSKRYFRLATFRADTIPR